MKLQKPSSFIDSTVKCTFHCKYLFVTSMESFAYSSFDKTLEGVTRDTRYLTRGHWANINLYDSTEVRINGFFRRTMVPSTDAAFTCVGKKRIVSVRWIGCSNTSIQVEWKIFDPFNTRLTQQFREITSPPPCMLKS